MLATFCRTRPGPPIASWLEGEGANECPRHNFGSVGKLIRCCHIGERFVVHAHNPDTGYVMVDYVEDLPNDGLIIETNDWYEPSPEAIETIWTQAVERMRADDPPNPDRSYLYGSPWLMPNPAM